ncbi:MAG: protein jag [Oscillospiraceae bacterium]|nr:protein jag [Oscillospiraceae bacterium]
MRKEVIVTAKTIEEAIELGAKELNMKEEDITTEVLERPKKGFFGIGATGYKVKLLGKTAGSDTAVEFLEKIIGHMKINAVPKIIEETKEELKIDIIGENLGTLIGYHGEILDSLQYLTYLAVNKNGDSSEGDGDSGDGAEKSETVKISLDIENYRKKREETLKTLAKKMAERVLKYNRPVTLEPMNAYERRIIHSTIQDIEGVSTHSIGQENDRRIVISREGGATPRPGGFQSRRPRSPYMSDRNKTNNDRDRNFRR